MVSCCICGFSAVKRTGDYKGVSFHVIPKSGKTRAKWMEVINKGNVERSSSRFFVCSLHFTKESLHTKPNGRIRLRPGACPSIQIFRKKNEQVSNTIFREPIECNKEDDDSKVLLPGNKTNFAVKSQNKYTLSIDITKLQTDSGSTKCNDTPRSVLVKMCNYPSKTGITMLKSRTDNSPTVPLQDHDYVTKEPVNRSNCSQDSIASITPDDSNTFEKADRDSAQQLSVESIHPQTNSSSSILDIFDKLSNTVMDDTRTQSVAPELQQDSAGKESATMLDSRLNSFSSEPEMDGETLSREISVNVQQELGRTMTSEMRNLPPVSSDTSEVCALKRKIQDLSFQNTRLTKKIKTLQRSNQRMRNKVKSLSDALKAMESESVLNKKTAAILKTHFSKYEELFTRVLLTTSGHAPQQEYPEEIRKFAFTVNFISSKAYKFIRRYFNNALPHPKTFHNWYKVVKGKPGFTSEALATLELEEK